MRDCIPLRPHGKPEGLDLLTHPLHLSYPHPILAHQLKDALDLQESFSYTQPWHSLQVLPHRSRIRRF